MSSQTALQKRLADRLAPDLTAEDKSYLEGLTKLDRLPLGKVDPRDVGPGSAEREITLRSVYVALNTTSTLEEDAGKAKSGSPLSELELDKQGRPVQRRPETALGALARRQGILLLGGPGSGKTTFLRHVALACAESWLSGANLASPLNLLGKRLLPLVVTLRRFAKTLAENSTPDRNLLITHLRHLLGCENALPGYWETIRTRLLEGEAILLLDGYDEVDNARRPLVSEIVADFRVQFKRTPMLVTCRTRTYEARETPRVPLPELRLAPLGEEQIKGFAAAWYREMAGMVGLNKSESQAWSDQKTQSLSRAVDKNPKLREMAGNPLLLTMMARVNARNPLPDSRAELYGEVLDQLMWEWEKARGEEEPPETLIDHLREIGRGKKDFLYWLAEFVFKQHKAQGSIAEVADISCSELEYELREFHGHRGKEDWALNVLNLVKESSGVLLCVDDRTLNVPHRSFQEYLAAVHLASEGKPEQIVELAKAAEHWHEVILLAAGYLVQEAKQSTVVAWVRKLLPAQRRTPEDGTLLKLAGEALSVIPRNWFERDRWDREFLEHVQRQLARTATSRGGVTPQERTALGVVLGRLGDPRPGVGLKNGLPDIAWVDVPAGPFLMGSDKAKDPEAWDDETEQFTCELIQEPYRISRYPITVAQFKAFVDAHGYELPDEYWTDSGRAWLRDSEARGPRAYGGVFETLNHPKVGVNWYEAMAFCSWLSEMTGQTITLPTEAQWEMAARGTDGRIYPWGNGFDPRYCNTRESQIGATSAVGLFPKGDSPCGASDTSGNVLEWCSTKWLSDYKGYDRKADDTREGDSSRVLRGGSFSIVRGGVRCACRYYDHPDGQYDGIGFRVASPGL